MRGLSFSKCADALLDTKVKPNAAGTQKFYDKAVEYIERSKNMNKQETDKVGYQEWLEFCAVIEVRWKHSLLGSLPKSACDHAYACTLLREVLDKVPSKRSERLAALSDLVNTDVFIGWSADSVSGAPLDNAMACEYFHLFHTVLENAKGRRETLLQRQYNNAELDALTE